MPEPMSEQVNPELVTITAINTTIGENRRAMRASLSPFAWMALRASARAASCSSPIFRDGTGTIQGIVPKAAVTPETFETIRQLTQESSVIVTGKVRADKRAPGGYELDVEAVDVIQRVPEERSFPYQP